MDNKQSIHKIQPLNWLMLLCLFQISLWTIFPNWLRHSLHADTLEGITWGNLWQWGYDKHPPLAAWLAATFAQLSDSSDWPVYLLAQLSIVIVFIAVWRLAKEYLPDTGALLAVFLLQGVLFYTNRVERVTPDTLQGPIWALMALTFYFAVTRESLKYWLITGVLAGLAVLTKYQAAIFFLPLLAVLLITPEGKKNLKTPAPWLGALVAIIVIAPHINWLLTYDYAAIGYFESYYINHDQLPVHDDKGINHILYPLSFALNSFSIIFILLLLCIPLLKTKKLKKQQYSSFQRLFITAIALGPFALTLLFGLVTGTELIPRWATPYFAWTPLFILIKLHPNISYAQFRRLAFSCLAVGFLICGLRMAYMHYKPLFDDKHWLADEFMPAREEMAYAEQLWQQHHDNPMPYIGGLHYHIAMLAAYNKTGIVPFLGLNPRESLWMKPEDFRRNGGMILIRHNKRKTEEVKKRLHENYPEAVFIGSKTFKPVSALSNTPSVVYVSDFYILNPLPFNKKTPVKESGS